MHNFISHVQMYRREFVVFLVAALVFGAIPFVQTAYELGPDWLSAPETLYVTGTYYSDRLREIVDGYPLIGNPYFFEYREEVPPAFFVADWLGTLPLLAGIPLVPTLAFNIAFWSFILFAFSHAILVSLRVPRLVAALGALFLGAAVYVQMAQPVSMQIIYPVFLIFLYAYVRWLERPEEFSRQIFFAVSTAVCAYVYTYSIQIVAVLYALLGLWVIARKRELLFSYVRTSAIGVLLCVPLIAFSLYQIQQEHYFETLERIGLVHTHIPVFLAFFVVLFPLAVGALAVLMQLSFREAFTFRSPSPPNLFLTTSGVTIVIVMFSNVITGTDLELAQHIERFLVPWLLFATLFLVSTHANALRESLRRFPKNCLVIFLVLFLLFGNTIYIVRDGPQIAWRAWRTDTEVERFRGFNTPLQWLRENVKEPAVVWADPDGVLNNLIPTFTQHYVLFEPKGVLQLLSNKEIEERYLLAHYFELDKEEIIRDYVQYAGTGNAVHAHKTHNKRVKLCKLFRGEEYNCGKEMDMVGYKGEEYFDGLLARYTDEIRIEPRTWMSRYNVAYVITDKETDSLSFTPSTFPSAKKLFDDGRFSVYSID